MKLGKILGTALPLAAMFIPGIGPAISAALAPMLGAGLAGAAGSAIGVGALSGGLGAALSGHNILKGAALGGVTGGIGKGLGLGAQAVGAGAGAQAVGTGAATALQGGAQAGMLQAMENPQGLKTLGTLGSKAAFDISKNKLLPALALGTLGLGMVPRQAPIPEEEPNRNPYAGTETMDPRHVYTPGADFVPGGAGGEFMFFDPARTTGAFRRADRHQGEMEDYSSPYGYAAGGYVQGPGDGQSDSVMTSINGSHPAKLSDGEYVLTAAQVSAIGNGSSNAGARKLNAMLKGLEHAR